MKWHRLIWTALLAGAWMGAAGAAEPTMAEVRNLLRAKLEGITDKELEQAQDLPALLKQFSGRVALLTNAPVTAQADDTSVPLLAKASVFDGKYAYVRLGRLAGGVTTAVEKKVVEFSASNQLAGLILDLRFATGRDFGQAAAVADLFLATETPLLEWRGETFRSKTKRTPLAWPVAVLVNGATRGAAEALAAILREQRAAVVIGSATAGQTAEMAEHKLSTGQTLQIATATLKLGDGRLLPGGKAQPDIVVPVSESDELVYLEDPFKSPGAVADTASGTIRSGRSKMNEAELVRLKREGFDGEFLRDSRTHRGWMPPINLVLDPVLAHGLDLLTGVNVLQAGKPGQPGRAP